MPVALALLALSWHVPAGETIRGAALSPDGRALYTWGTRLLSWTVPEGRMKVLRERGPEFGEGGCVFDGNIVVQEGLGLGKMVMFRAPAWQRVEIESATEFHDCLDATIFGRRGILISHRHGQVRFYEPPDWRMTEIYSFYTPSNQTGLLLQDVDGDGRPDILCGNYWIRSPERFDLPWRLFAINTYSEVAESAMMRLLWHEGGLVAAQGHLENGKVMRFDKPTDPRQQWIEHRLGEYRFPHGLAALPGGEIAIGDADGIVTKRGRIDSAGPVLALFAIGNDLLAVGPRSIRYLRRP